MQRGESRAGIHNRGFHETRQMSQTVMWVTLLHPVCDIEASGGKNSVQFIDEEPELWRNVD